MVSGEIFTNQGGSNVTNGSSGVYFPGTVGNYLLNASATFSMTNSTNSLWIRLNGLNIAGTYNTVLASGNTAGSGYYYRANAILCDAGGFTVASGLTQGSQWDVLISAGSPPSIYVDGVLNQTMTPEMDSAFYLTHIGQDADSDAYFNGTISQIALWTNNTLTLSQAAALYTFPN